MRKFSDWIYSVLLALVMATILGLAGLEAIEMIYAYVHYGKTMLFDMQDDCRRVVKPLEWDRYH